MGEESRQCKSVTGLHVWLRSCTDGAHITRKWKIPLLSLKVCSSWTTCTIRSLLKVSEEIAAKNQQLPVDRHQKESH